MMARPDRQHREATGSQDPQPTASPNPSLTVKAWSVRNRKFKPIDPDLGFRNRDRPFKKNVVLNSTTRSRFLGVTTRCASFAWRTVW